jgi:hypothetical protein
MVQTRKDRTIVITKPTSTILCSCPVKPNNTWIFPSQLMTGNLSPTTAVPTGISGTSGAIVLPLRITHKSRHFTEEEVKRAIQARELHCFLKSMIRPSSHPHDQALKSTLDQGHLSHHTHLTSQDIELMTNFFGSCTACTIGKLHKADLYTTSLFAPIR